MLDIHGVFLYTDYIMTKKDYIAIGIILNKYSKSEHMMRKFNSILRGGA